MSVTELRDGQSAEWHAWYQKHREREIAKAIQRQAELQAETLAHAYRDGKPWTAEEFDQAMSGRPIRETALLIGRSYKSVVRARQRRRKMLGLGIEATKTESDPYDGSDRVGVLYVKER